MFERLPKVGGRIWKTGLAIALSLALARIFNVSEPVFVAIVALICVQPTVVKTFKYGSEQVQATIIGGAVALGMLIVVASFPYPFVRAFAAGTAAIIAMWICMAFRWYDALVLAACTVVVIMIQSEVDGNIFGYSAQRTLATILGVSIAVAVNAMVFWQRAENMFPKRLPQIASQAFNEFEEAVNAFCDREQTAVDDATWNWHKRKQSFEAAASELIWSRRSGRSKRLSSRRSVLAPVLSEIHGILESIHFSAFRISESANYMLKHHPREALWENRLFDAIRVMLQKPSNLQQAIVIFLRTKDSSALREFETVDLFELDRDFDNLMQQAIARRDDHPHSDDTMPIFEIAKVTVELRNYMRLLTILRQSLLENERAFKSKP